MKLLGKDIIVFVKVGGIWKTLAYGTTCEIDVQAELIEKAPVGRWKQYVVKKYSWSVSTAHLISSEETNVAAFDMLKSIEDSRVLFGSIANTDAERNVGSFVPDGRFGIKGNVKITRLSMNAANKQKAGLSISFVGNGELESIFKNVLFVPKNSDGFQFADGGNLYVLDRNFN